MEWRVATLMSVLTTNSAVRQKQMFAWHALRSASPSHPSHPSIEGYVPKADVGSRASERCPYRSGEVAASTRVRRGNFDSGQALTEQEDRYPRRSRRVGKGTRTGAGRCDDNQRDRAASFLLAWHRANRPRVRQCCDRQCRSGCRAPKRICIESLSPMGPRRGARIAASRQSLPARLTVMPYDHTEGEYR